MEPSDKLDSNAGSFHSRPAGKGDSYDLADAKETAPTAAAPAPAAHSVRFSAEERNGVHVITLARSDVVDGQYIEQLGNDLNTFTKSLDAPRLLLDLGSVSHLSSAALGMLIVLKSTAEGRGGGICLANLQDNLRQIFTLMKLDTTLKIHDSTDAAMKSLL
jgi:anti-anti-sigma factor